MIDESLLREEVEELTYFLHNSPEWHEQRSIVSAHGLSPEEVLFINFWETEEGIESGAVLTLEGRVLQWERNYHSNDFSPASVKWQDITNSQVQLAEILTLAVALQMRRS